MKILHICNAYQTNSLYQELFDRIQKDNIDQVVVAPGYYKSGSECVNGVQVLYYFRKTGRFSYISKFHIIISCKSIVYIVMCFYQETN